MPLFFPTVDEYAVEDLKRSKRGWTSIHLPFQQLERIRVRCWLVPSPCLIIGWNGRRRRPPIQSITNHLCITRSRSKQEEHPRLAATLVGSPTDSDPFPPASAALPRHVAAPPAHLFNYHSCKEASRVKLDKKKSCCCS